MVQTNCWRVASIASKANSHTFPKGGHITLHPAKPENGKRYECEYIQVVSWTVGLREFALFGEALQKVQFS